MSATRRNYDVTIAGAGIIGLSIAFELARRSRLTIGVLDKASSVGSGSTGASSAVCRYRYTRDEVLKLAANGISAYQHWGDYTELTNPAAVFQNDGVLWMPDEHHHWADTECERLQRFGISAQVLDHQDLQSRFPAISACTRPLDLESGDDHPCSPGGRYLLEVDGGCMDPMATAQDLVAACRAKGVDVHFRSEVMAVSRQGDGVTGVTLGGGERISTPLLINAAGPWCHRLHQAAGFDLSWDLRPTRIQVLYLDRGAELTGDIPVTVDMSGGVYFRTQNRGQQLIVGSVLEADEREEVGDPDDFNRSADDDFCAVKLHALCHRLPALPQRGRVRSYCGLYTVNRDDVHPLVGPSPIPGYWVANGFSGHGFKLAPAIGSLLARAITGIELDSDVDVPTSFLAVDREPIKISSKSVLA